MTQGILKIHKRALSCAILLCLPIGAIAAPVSYVDLALGLGVHTLDDSDQGAASKLIKAGFGVQWFPFLSTQVGIWSWNSEESSNKRDSEEREVGLFDGLSSSLEVSLQWPIENSGSSLSAGPYYRYGRHCWTAVLTGLLQSWSRKGCSDLNSIGFSFPVPKEQNTAVYIEFTQTDFDDLSSRSLQLGAKLAF